MSETVEYAIGLGFVILVITVTVFGWRYSMRRAMAMINEALK